MRRSSYKEMRLKRQARMIQKRGKCPAPKGCGGGHKRTPFAEKGGESRKGRRVRFRFRCPLREGGKGEREGEISTNLFYQ